MFSDLGDKTVQDAQAAIKADLEKLDPLMTKLYMMVNALIHNAIDRFEINVTFRIKPNPGPNPNPDRDAT